MPTIFVGVDPGKSGAIAVIRSPRNLSLYKIPVTTIRTPKRGRTKGGAKRYSVATHIDLPGLRDVFLEISQEVSGDTEVLVFLEEVSAGPNDGRVSAFSFGKTAGMIEAAIACANLPYEMVRPNVWRPAMVGRGTSKDESIRIARRLFPTAELPNKSDEGKAEALLIAEYGRRVSSGVKLPKVNTTGEQRKTSGFAKKVTKALEEAPVVLRARKRPIKRHFEKTVRKARRL